MRTPLRFLLLVVLVEVILAKEIGLAPRTVPAMAETEEHFPKPPSLRRRLMSVRALPSPLCCVRRIEHAKDLPMEAVSPWTVSRWGIYSQSNQILLVEPDWVKTPCLID
jgi:hypothetical protein